MQNVITDSYKYILKKQIDKAIASGDSGRASELMKALNALDGTPEDRTSLSGEIETEYKTKNPHSMDDSSRDKIINLLRVIIPENRQGPAVRIPEEDEEEFEGKRWRRLPKSYGHEEI